MKEFSPYFPYFKMLTVFQVLYDIFNYFTHAVSLCGTRIHLSAQYLTDVGPRAPLSAWRPGQNHPLTAALNLHLEERQVAYVVIISLNKKWCPEIECGKRSSIIAVFTSG